jgi:hypothetical protein
LFPSYYRSTNINLICQNHAANKKPTIITQRNNFLNPNEIFLFYLILAIFFFLLLAISKNKLSRKHTFDSKLFPQVFPESSFQHTLIPTCAPPFLGTMMKRNRKRESESESEREKGRKNRKLKLQSKVTRKTGTEHSKK